MNPFWISITLNLLRCVLQLQVGSALSAVPRALDKNVYSAVAARVVRGQPLDPAVDCCSVLCILADFLHEAHERLGWAAGGSHYDRGHVQAFLYLSLSREWAHVAHTLLHHALLPVSRENLFQSTITGLEFSVLNGCMLGHLGG